MGSFLTYYHLVLNRFSVRVWGLGSQHAPAEKSLAEYSSICLPRETPSIKANCHRNPKGRSLFFSSFLNVRQLHISNTLEGKTVEIQRV